MCRRRRLASTLSSITSGRDVFTGITTDIGEVLQVQELAEGLRRLLIACSYERASIALGASIACSGVCLTAGRGSPSMPLRKRSA